MKQKKRPKRKILTKGKSYNLTDCALYNLKSKKRLEKVLMVSMEEIKRLKLDKGNYRVFSQQDNVGKERVIEEPVGRLDFVHTRIASLLCRVQLPEYLYSGVKGRSHIANAQAHIGMKKVLVTDIKGFFRSTTWRHVYHFFYRTMNCSEDCAAILAEICTYDRHVPTGSRISMPIAFYANRDMFEELNHLAAAHNCQMTVYVDDLTFSGPGVNRLFRSTVKKIIERHNQSMHPKKTKIYEVDGPKLITGAVVLGDHLLVRNKQHKEIYEDLVQWVCCVDQGQVPKSLTNRLLGRLNSVSSINPRFKGLAQHVLSRSG